MHKHLCIIKSEVLNVENIAHNYNISIVYTTTTTTNNNTNNNKYYYYIICKN